MASIGIFVEGGANEKNGSLRVAFGQLFRPVGGRHRVQFKMCKDTDEAIKQFRAEQEGRSRIFDRAYLLIDLEGTESQRTERLRQKALTAYADQIFFMVQKMEAWFLSQPQVVRNFYRQGCGALPTRPAHEVPNPDTILGHATDGTQKGRYHKVSHAVMLLPDLHLPTLRNAFPDVERLVAKLTV